MKVTLDDDLIYISLQNQSNANNVSTITNVNGYLLYDHVSNWLGFRIFRTQGKNNKRIGIPIFISKLKYGKVIETREYIDVLFTDHVFVAKMKEQQCHIDLNHDGIVGIEILRYPQNPIGKKKWVRPLLRNQIHED